MKSSRKKKSGNSDLKKYIIQAHQAWHRVNSHSGDWMPCAKCRKVNVKQFVVYDPGPAQPAGRKRRFGWFVQASAMYAVIFTAQALGKAPEDLDWDELLAKAKQMFPDAFTVRHPDRLFVEQVS